MATINDRGGRATRHLADGMLEAAVDSLRINASIRREVLALLRSLEAKIVQLLIQHDPSAVIRPKAQAKRLAKIVEQVLHASTAAYGEMARSTSDALEDVAVLGVARTVQTVAASLSLIGVEQKPRQPSVEQQKALQRTVLTQGAPHGTWWDRQSTNLVATFEDQMREGLDQGDTITRLVQRVRGGTRGGLPVVGFMETSQRSAERLVRTAVQSHSNAAHVQVLDANTDLFEVWVHLATLDSRTSRWCIPRDRKIWTLDKEPIGHAIPWKRPPIHWNCRSIMTAQVKGAGPTTPTRASEDGPVPSNWSSGRWLREKPKSYQDRVLGASVAKLWRGHKISLSQTLNFSGRPKTVQQIREELGLK